VKTNDDVPDDDSNNNYSNNAGAWMSVTSEWCVLSGRGLCVGPIARPEESNRVLYVKLNVIVKPCW
jgi:hypothetical protein